MPEYLRTCSSMFEKDVSLELEKRGNSSIITWYGVLFSTGCVARDKNACSRPTVIRQPASLFSASERPPRVIMQEVLVSMSLLKLSLFCRCPREARRLGEKVRRSNLLMVLSMSCELTLSENL